MGFLSGGTPQSNAPTIKIPGANDPVGTLGPRPSVDPSMHNSPWEGDYQKALAAQQAWDTQAAQIQQQGGVSPFDKSQFNPTNYGGALGSSINQTQNYGAGVQQGQQAYQQANAGLTGLAGQLQAQANGQGPSLAQNQLREGTERTQNLAAGQIAGQRGVNPALAARLVANQSANANQQMAGQSADLRLQEQMAARQQLAGVLGQQMQGGLSQYGQAGQLGLGQMGTLGGLNMGQQTLQAQLEEAQRNRILQGTLANQQAQLQTNATNAGISSSNNAQASQVAGGVIGAIGAGAMMLSDERQKQNIAPAGAALDQFMDSMGEHSYQYKDPSNGPGTRYGPMAQEMEHSAVGRSIVKDTPQGKAVDMRAALGAALAGQARLNERLEALEGKKMSKGGKVTSKDLTPADKAQMDTSTWGLDGAEPKDTGSTRRLGDAALQEPKKMAFGGDVGQGLGGALMGFAGGMGGGTPGFNPGLVQLGQALRQKQQAQAAAVPMGLSTAGAPALPSPTAPAAPSPSLGGGVMAPPQQQIMAGPATMKAGGRVPGAARVSGDSEKNDTVPALLSPGEIVIPRSKAKDPDQAKAFVEAIASHKGPDDEADGYGKVLQHTRDLHERLKKIEHALGGMVY